MRPARAASTRRVGAARDPFPETPRADETLRPAYELPTDRNGRRFRRVLAWGLAASAAAHVVLFVTWRGEPERAAGPARERAAPARPAPGDYLRVVRLPEAGLASAKIPAPPPPVNARSVTPVAVAAVAAGDRIRVRLDQPAAPGPPGGNGSGAHGEGGTAHLSPPVPRSLYPEWSPPASVRGTTVTIRVRVDSLGRPVGPVELQPPTPDPTFNQQLVARVRQMEFRPALLAGRPVAAWAELTFSF